MEYASALFIALQCGTVAVSPEDGGSLHTEVKESHKEVVQGFNSDRYKTLLIV